MIEIKDFELANKLYEKAKELLEIDEQKSIIFINQLPLKYKDGFWAYKNAINKNEESIDNSIFLLKTAIDLQSYDIDINRLRLLEIGFSIVDIYPYKALDIFNTINETYNIIGTLPCEILDLSVDIVVSIAHKDIGRSLGLLNIIEVDYYKLEALEKIYDLCKQKNITNIIKILIVNVKRDISKYDKGYLQLQN